ncbi:hypothetical protein FKG94_08915 [Exilibacterium tricleocarpae]|uniref:RHS repeat-associated core domain-containing protein n=1 Tax=Exilibacterium tricleocarpae TaxID=2591008 RepID=A0A545TVH4_9GAMM|nr:RHS repeat-associated core domain-containing protein [Exilibacterium tricleocarpae]TQV81216.1 hypothetical protein FKG94_08915 [Exilibacterium tricleocarpae]
MRVLAMALIVNIFGASQVTAGDKSANNLLVTDTDFSEARASQAMPVEPRKLISEHLDDSGPPLLNTRYYDPMPARFVSADPSDPLTPGVGLNRYTYAFNNPVYVRDPSGLSAEAHDPDGGDSDANEASDNDGGLGNADVTDDPDRGAQVPGESTAAADDKDEDEESRPDVPGEKPADEEKGGLLQDVIDAAKGILSDLIDAPPPPPPSKPDVPQSFIDKQGLKDAIRDQGTVLGEGLGEKVFPGDEGYEDLLDSAVEYIDGRPDLGGRPDRRR